MYLQIMKVPPSRKHFSEFFIGYMQDFIVVQIQHLRLKKKMLITKYMRPKYPLYSILRQVEFLINDFKYLSNTFFYGKMFKSQLIFKSQIPIL